MMSTSPSEAVSKDEAASKDAKTRPQATPPTANPEPSLREFIGLVREDWSTNGRDWHHLGTQALFAYRLGRFRHNIGFVPVRKALSLLYKFLQRRAVRGGIELRDSTNLGRRVRIPHAGAIVFHRDGIVGDDCVVRQGVTMGRAGLAAAADDHPTIGSGVEIAAGAVIMGAIVIGDGAKIGPNCVVTTDVPEGSTVFSPTARTLRF